MADILERKLFFEKAHKRLTSVVEKVKDDWEVIKLNARLVNLEKYPLPTTSVNRASNVDVTAKSIIPIDLPFPSTDK